jgi:hypothetical protein
VLLGSDFSFIMFGKSGKYLGLHGVKLQIAAGIIAGMDFFVSITASLLLRDFSNG